MTSATTAAPTTATTSTTRAPRLTTTSVGGRGVGAAALHAVRVEGRAVDVLLPRGVDFAAYVAALAKTGAFSAQAAELKTLASTSTSTAAPARDRRPTVGIVLSEPKMLVPGHHKNTETLLALVEQMGCRAVLIPPCADLLVKGGADARARVRHALVHELDGLVGPGGADVDPAVYGEAVTDAVHTNPLRDAFEADFVRAALDGDLFAFGICRSHQLWNAAAGGSLIQDVQNEQVVSVSHREGHHPVTVERGSMLFEATRQRALRVNSLHHQAVDLPGWGFKVTARVKDEHTGKDMIEATERWNGITTQFHPELMQDDPAQRALFSTLGRRAHVFALLKSLPAPRLSSLVAALKSDPRFEASDIDWAKRELGRRLPA